MKTDPSLKLSWHSILILPILEFSATEKKNKKLKDSHRVLGGVGLRKYQAVAIMENYFVLIVNELEELIGNFLAKRRCNSKDDKIESPV